MTKEELSTYMDETGRHVYYIVRHVSRSGMSRSISFFVVSEGSIRSIDYHIKEHLSYKFDRNNGGFKVEGCGMDMGFAVIYDLGRYLWPNGDNRTITGRNGDKTPETDGGYLLDYTQL